MEEKREGFKDLYRLGEIRKALPSEKYAQNSKINFRICRISLVCVCKIVIYMEFANIVVRAE